MNVLRVENRRLWRQYSHCAHDMRAARATCSTLSPELPRCRDPSLPQCLRWWQLFDNSLNEALLWHGTSLNNIAKILNDGMDERVCRLNGMLGAGLYFAQDSCKSGQYALKDGNGSHWFLLCRVLLGNPYQTHRHMPHTRRPPDNYDSVVFEPGAADVGHHRELVVYDRHQVYPEYIVEACTM